MRKLLATLLLTILFCAGCSSDKSKMQVMLTEIAAKPAAGAGDTDAAKGLYDEANKFVAWLEAHPEDSTPEMLDQARALRNRRMKEGGMSVVNGVVEWANKALGGITGDGKGGGIDLSNIDVGKSIRTAAKDILGVNDPRMKTFGCKDKDGREVDVTKEGAAKLCR